MFTNIYHIGYLTEDIASAIEFYLKIYDAELISEATGATGGKMAFLKVGNTEVEFIEAPERVREAGKGNLLLDHIGYLVDDIDAAVAKLRARGVKFMTEAPYTNARGHRLIYADASTTQGVRLHLTYTGS
ncbi:MAG TPA: VOC family protein [Chloroflexota bacterium]|nr:VOC family protein [Chloroflexota bacterium]